MALYSYSIAAGFDNIAGLANIETIFSTPPRAVRLPLGVTTRVALSGKQRTDGEQIVIWRWSAARFSELDTFVTAYLIGVDWDKETSEVTISTRFRDGGFSGTGSRDYWNALLYLPIDGVNYQHINTRLVRDLEIRFRVIEEAT